MTNTISNINYNFQLVTDNYSFWNGNSINSTFEYPVAPLVSACYDKEFTNVLIARVILYIAKSDQSINLSVDPPVFKNGVLFLNCCYDVQYERIGDVFDIWSLEYYCDVEGAVAGMLSVTLDNKDPKTSRGTVTCVQRQ